jgi:hypothetical protein
MHDFGKFVLAYSLMCLAYILTPWEVLISDKNKREIYETAVAYVYLICAFLC